MFPTAHQYDTELSARSSCVKFDGDVKDQIAKNEVLMLPTRIYSFKIKRKIKTYMITVYTRSEFNRAIDNRESIIICKGSVAEEFKSKHRKKKALSVGGIVLAIGGLIAIPFTCGASGAVTAGTIAGLTVGTITLTTAELTMICGTTVALLGILKGAKVTFNKDGNVIVKPQYK